MTDKEKDNRVNALAMTFLEELQIRPHLFADQILRAYKTGYYQSEKDSLTEEPVSEALELAATKYAQDKYMPVQTSQAFKAGANYVLDEIENFMKDLDLGNSAEEKFYKLDVIADIHGFIQKLKEK